MSEQDESIDMDFSDYKGSAEESTESKILRDLRQNRDDQKELEKNPSAFNTFRHHIFQDANVTGGELLPDGKKFGLEIHAEGGRVIAELCVIHEDFKVEHSVSDACCCEISRKDILSILGIDQVFMIEEYFPALQSDVNEGGILNIQELSGYLGVCITYPETEFEMKLTVDPTCLQPVMVFG